MAIFNQRDYRSAKSRLAQLKAALGPDAVVDDLTSGLAAEISSARRQALRSEADALERELQRYDQLQSASSASPEFATDDLGLLPIVARIARRLSQRELADRLGISEQQVQRYESDRYSGISLSRYTRLLELLGIAICPKLAPYWGESQENSSNSTALEIDGSVLTAIRKRNWISVPRGTAQEGVGQILATYVAESAGLSRTGSLYRRHIRDEAAIDDNALLIWQARVLREATSNRHALRSKFNIVDIGWLTNLAKLSARPDGPVQAANYLRAHGILLVFVPHLPRTRLDGAAMLLSDGTPVIALTLRYDRLDSFWFTLFHEVGHVLLHFHAGLDVGFIDNLDVIDDGDKERDADLFALSALISDGVWNAAPARFSNSSEAVRKLASSLGIHPAIIAGRIRKERADYAVFNDLIGTGTVRRMLADQFSA